MPGEGGIVDSVGRQQSVTCANRSRGLNEQALIIVNAVMAGGYREAIYLNFQCVSLFSALCVCACACVCALWVCGGVCVCFVCLFRFVFVCLCIHVYVWMYYLRAIGVCGLVSGSIFSS